MGTITICIVAVIGAVLAVFYSIETPVSFEVANITAFGRTRRGFEEAALTFNVDADLTPLMHVNTNLFYSYIVAEWGESKTDQHSVILWNELIKKSDPHFVANNIPGNFTLRQVGPSMKGKSVQLHFKIQQVPYVGFLRTNVLATKELTLPDKYIYSN
ncbi:putative signal peptidase complex subunit 3 [Histomonas meleagridis]|uniref:putative signal peptidase complex subunit 3 n=1 Tax=Histomonas meleagridis TaxID=135588 RepID=UPI003559EE94|nr:putative signal peptidase complex subunit 3 [Histomonas meleagridis]KAH0805948.1 putative signal peptidase complex subunit 3 [Histomonas meleagridis]